MEKKIGVSYSRAMRSIHPFLAWAGLLLAGGSLVPAPVVANPPTEPKRIELPTCASAIHAQAVLQQDVMLIPPMDFRWKGSMRASLKSGVVVKSSDHLIYNRNGRSLWLIPNTPDEAEHIPGRLSGYRASVSNWDFSFLGNAVVGSRRPNFSNLEWRPAGDLTRAQFQPLLAWYPDVLETRQRLNPNAVIPDPLQLKANRIHLKPGFYMYREEEPFDDRFLAVHYTRFSMGAEPGEPELVVIFEATPIGLITKHAFLSPYPVLGIAKVPGRELLLIQHEDFSEEDERGVATNVYDYSGRPLWNQMAISDSVVMLEDRVLSVLNDGTIQEYSLHENGTAKQVFELQDLAIPQDFVESESVLTRAEVSPAQPRILASVGPDVRLLDFTAGAEREIGRIVLPTTTSDDFHFDFGFGPDGRFVWVYCNAELTFHSVENLRVIGKIRVLARKIYGVEFLPGNQVAIQLSDLLGSTWTERYKLMDLP